MEINTIDASQLSKMFSCRSQKSEAKKEWINELNVFLFRMEIPEPI